MKLSFDDIKRIGEEYEQEQEEYKRRKHRKYHSSYVRTKLYYDDQDYYDFDFIIPDVPF